MLCYATGVWIFNSNDQHSVYHIINESTIRYDMMRGAERSALSQAYVERLRPAQCNPH